MKIPMNTFTALALSGLLVAPLLGAASCSGEDLDGYQPPDGLGGYDPGDKPPVLSGSGSGVGAGGPGQGGLAPLAARDNHPTRQAC